MEEKTEKTVDKSIDERVHQQLVYKDNRIIDLNNVILDKERQILDLQERVREHNEVNTVKNQAMRIVQQKFEEMHRDKKDMSTETDHNLLGYNSPSTSSSRSAERRTRSSSPGHVIAARKSTTTTSSGTFSPPPTDPPLESTSKLGANLPDIDGILRKHSRKRVTFDLNPGARHHHTPDALESALTEASSENVVLRQQVYELNAAVEKMKSDYESEIVKYTKEAKTAGLKAKVAATARIKELESSLEEVNGKFDDEVERLREEVATLRSSRNWEIEQNGQLREKIAHLKEKTHKLTDELDESEKAKRELDHECEESKNLNELMIDDLLQAENAINFHVRQKEAIFEDVDRLKDAIVAQDRFIDILEADIKIYEQHIGLLRESLGASKIDHRALIKSKAFETKLLALEREKEQIDKKSNEDRLKTKALDKKCRVLMEENERLVAQLCDQEMTSVDETKDRRIAEQEERIRQVSAALEAERDVSQQLREAKEVLERELLAKTRHGEVSSNRMKMDVEMSKMDAQNKIEAMNVEVEAAKRKASDVMEEVEQLRATNFDLQMHIETAKRTLEELANSNEELEERVREVEENMEEKEEDLKQSTWDVETLTRQNEALRVELDGIRQGFHDTNELSEEVKLLKAELERQQELHRAQFEASLQKLDEEGDVVERKTSLEVQQEQYILAFEQKIEEMNEQLRESTNEKYSLQRLLEQKEHELLKMADNVTPVQRKTTAVLEAPSLEDIQKTEVQMTNSAPPEASRAPRAQSVPQSAPEQQDSLRVNELTRQNQELLEKLQRVEMEANLSGELNVELGRAMLELEEQNELLRREQNAQTAEESARGRELEMHVMLVQEMNEQIQTMQSRIDAMGQANRAENEVVEKMKVEVASAQEESEKAQDEIKRLLHSLSEFELARKTDLEQANREHDTEIRAFSIRMEDARREIADLEVKLQDAQTQLLAAKEPVPVIQETQILTSSTPVPDVVETFEAPELVRAPQAPQAREAAEVPQDDDQLREQNRLYRECHQDVSRDMSKLIELKDELEIAVQALKAEIWSLNGQLKASILDREGLEDKVAELDAMVEKEKKRAIALDVELQEQIDLTDKAVRRAAEAENESNQRMAECLEKETSREEIEKAYTRLNEYYNQLQEAYNNVYAQLAQAQSQTFCEQLQTSTSVTTTSSLATSSESAASEAVIDSIMTILLITRDPSISLSTQEKLSRVAEKLKSLVSEYDENQKALEEQRRISEALEQRLQTLELENNSDDVTTTRERVQQLEGEIEWKEEECEGLKRRIRELEKALEAVAERADEEEAARLTTRQADVDSLFRTNAELAHTNVRLQNEVDEHEEWRSKVGEEKQQLEQLVKDLELQVAELMEQHETHIQQEHLAQTAAPDSAELQETQSEVKRLSGIEKILNNRILALEDQNSELEERLQEMEEELMTFKTEKSQAVVPSQSAPETSGWDDWEEEQPKPEKPAEHDNSELLEAKSEVERLTEVEKALTMRMEALQMHNEQLEEQVKQKVEALPVAEEWGWGDEKDKTPAQTPKEDEWGWGEEQAEEKVESSSSENAELVEAKGEVERLAQIEKVLNNRIMALEDQNLELQERLQEMEDELMTVKTEQAQSVTVAPSQSAPEASGWDDWEEEQPKPEKPLEQDNSELKQTIAELQDRLKFQKEIIEKVEAELIEQQDKYDELQEIFDKSGDKEKELESLRALLETMKQERDDLKAQLEENEAEKSRLEERVKELEEAQRKKEEESGWNDDGSGEDEEKSDGKDEEIAELRQTQLNLTQKIEHLEKENSEQDAEHQEAIEKLSEVEQQLVDTRRELEDVKKTLLEKETSEQWNDDSWADNEEFDKLKEVQKALEQKVEDLTEQLSRVKENEQRITRENNELKTTLKATELELQATRQKLAEAEAASWGDDDGWGNEEKTQAEAVEQQLLEELEKRNDTIQKLLEQISQLQKELGEASDSSASLEELEALKKELQTVTEQNGLLKDSEARLLDHADNFAVRMDEYKEKCVVLSERVKELEEQVKKSGEVKVQSEELARLRQQLANAEQQVRTLNSTISDREGQIAELRRQIAEHQKIIEELRAKLKSIPRRVNRPSTSSTSHPVPRPDSQMSTSSRISTSSSFVPDAHANPIQSAGSAFDVVVPQGGEPVRRRNK